MGYLWGSDLTKICFNIKILGLMLHFFMKFSRLFALRER